MLYLYLYIYMYIYQNAQLHFIEYFVTQIFIFKIILEFISVFSQHGDLFIKCSKCTNLMKTIIHFNFF